MAWCSWHGCLLALCTSRLGRHCQRCGGEDNGQPCLAFERRPRA